MALVVDSARAIVLKMLRAIQPREFNRVWAKSRNIARAKSRNVARAKNAKLLEPAKNAFFEDFQKRRKEKLLSDFVHENRPKPILLIVNDRRFYPLTLQKDRPLKFCRVLKSSPI